jgi:hypothetical protein
VAAPVSSINTRWSGSHDETEVAAALFGAYGVTNAVNLYVERGRETLDAVHFEAAVRVPRSGSKSFRRSFGRHRLSTSVPRFNNITMGDRRARDKIPVILPEWMRGVGAAAYQLLKSREVAEDLGSCPPAI